MLPMAAGNLIIGILTFLCSGVLLAFDVEPFASWFYCFAWWSYILVVDSIVFYRTGQSLLLSRTREFLFLLPLSVVIWVTFEAFNLVLKNWHYVNVLEITPVRWAGYCIAFATVLPGIFETFELLESTRWLKSWTVKPRIFSYTARTGIMFAGAACLSLCVLFPGICFALVWCGFFLLLEPVIYRCGEPSILRDWEQGSLRKPVLLMASGFVCGVLWEFWNYWAATKWIYTVPFFNRYKLFEMTAPGFLGFIPFALECYAMASFAYLCRRNRGWERDSSRVSGNRGARPAAAAGIAACCLLWCLLVFAAMDAQTVGSFRSFIRDLPGLQAAQKERLIACGIITVRDLQRLKRSADERQRIQSCAQADREELTAWITAAGMVMLKGMGTDNYRLLAAAGITNTAALAAQQPQALHRSLQTVAAGGAVPSCVPEEAKLRVWISAARDAAGS